MTDGPKVYTGEFFEAWETFADQIGLIFQYSGEDARPIATRQMQFVSANVALATLLHNIGEPVARDNFRALAEALQDVVHGINHPLFRVEKANKHAPGKRGRQRDTSETWRVRATLCTGIQFLIASGLAQDKAIDFVFRRHKKQLERLLRTKTALKTSLPEWLESFQANAISNDVALSIYKLQMKELASVRVVKTPAAIRQAGEQLVAAAAASASKIVKNING
jgi:hypothetical protein